MNSEYSGLLEVARENHARAFYASSNEVNGDPEVFPTPESYEGRVDLSVTKEQPKEMLPVFARGKNGGLCLKPIVQLVFEQLYQVGFTE